MSFLQHPAFQSLALPAVLAAAGLAGMRALPAPVARRWAPLVGSLALLVTLAVLPGFIWPATSSAQKLPWVVLAGLLLAGVVQGPAQSVARAHTSVLAHGLMAIVCWVMASLWLAGGRTTPLVATAMALAGAGVLALLAWCSRPTPSGQGALAPKAEQAERAEKPVKAEEPVKADASSIDGNATVPAALTVAALGLAALAGSGGSLLLAQLALMLATVTATAGLWAWLRPDSGLTASPAAWMPLGLAWLSIAQVLPAVAGVGPVSLALLALAFLAPVLLSMTAGARAWVGRRPRLAALAVAGLAAVPVALALAWHLGVASRSTQDAGPAALDDPYYEPRWK